MTSTRPSNVEIQWTFTMHYLYNMAVGLVIYSTARTFKANAKEYQGQDIWPDFAFGC